ncbi:MAG: HDIG domain-containing protein [Ardenticatenaceae bacterium]|nr:HDIG domain-containing protein [Ardenticatenaceae bacterium]
MDLTPYEGRWVALIDGQVAGVGHTAVAAEHMARHNRPRERITLQFVESPAAEPLLLPPLLAQLRPIFNKLDTPVYLVGGSVRDALLGRDCHDLDFVVPENAVKLTYRVADALGVPAYVLDRERDTGRVVLADTTLDFARFRGADLTADLQDRDFTINAIALPAAASTRRSLIDPTNGLADLEARQLRLTHDEALQDDPVRTLRALRQVIAFDLTLDEDTAVAITQAAPLIHTTSPERIRDELLKLLRTAVPAKALHLLQQHGLLAQVLPEIAALADLAQSPPHHEPVLAHTISVLRWLVQVEKAIQPESETADPPLTLLQQKLAPYTAPLAEHLARSVDGGVSGLDLLRWSAVFHDVGKAETRTEENGRIRFLGHDKVGASIAARRLRRLAFSNEAINHIKQTVTGHMRPLWLVENQGDKPSRRAVYRFFRDIKTAGLDVALLALADHLATYDGPGDEQQWHNLVGLVAALCDFFFQQYTEVVAPPPLLDGRQLMTALQLEPGPEIGRLLRLLEEAQAVGDITTPEEALLFAQRSRQ